MVNPPQGVQKFMLDWLMKNIVMRAFQFDHAGAYKNPIFMLLIQNKF